MTMYQCPLWKGCTAHTDPSSHVCDHVGPHEWSYADGDECGWLEGECTEVCQLVASDESFPRKAGDYLAYHRRLASGESKGCRSTRVSIATSTLTGV